MPILVADDDSISRQMLQFQLEQWGHSVLAAEDGDDAWKLFQSHDCPIVITDWMMPRMAGIDLIRKIRETEQANYTYIILQTSKSKQSDLIAGLMSGADDFLIKPVDPSELNARLQVGVRISGRPPRGSGAASVGETSSPRDTVVQRPPHDAPRFQDLLATVPGLVFIIQCDGLIVTCGGQHDFEPSAVEALVGTNIRGAITVETQTELFPVFQDVVSKKAALIKDIDLQVAGRLYHMRAHLTAFDSSSVVAILRDQTPQKHAAALLGQLTERETQILRAVVAGKPNKQIARELDIAMKTVEAHRARLMKKLNARSAADLVRVALTARVEP